MTVHSFKQYSADVVAGSALGFINDWGLLIGNIVLIGGRLLLEYWIIKNKKDKK